MILKEENLMLGQEALLGTIYRFRAEKSKIQKDQLYFGHDLGLHSHQKRK